MIAGALVTGIKSDLPGDVIGTVTEPVYDSATGKFLLIPQGSRLMGKYNSQMSYGQSRVQVVWNRIILPDTSSLKLDNLAGADPAGYSGLEDGVDWHWDRVFAVDLKGAWPSLALLLVLLGLVDLVLVLSLEGAATRWVLAAASLTVPVAAMLALASLLVAAALVGVLLVYGLAGLGVARYGYSTTQQVLDQVGGE